MSKLLSQFNFYLNKDSMSTPISIQLLSQFKESLLRKASKLIFTKLRILNGKTV